VQGPYPTFGIKRMGQGVDGQGSVSVLEEGPAMEDVARAAELTAKDQEKKKKPKRPARPRPGDERAYEDSWYQVLKSRVETDPKA
jgi:hypothetical protein